MVVTFIDLENRIIPDKINFGFLIYSIIFFLLTELITDSPLPVVGRSGLISVLVGITSITGFFLTIDLISILIFKKPGIGYGDVKMGLNLGISLGYYAPLVPLIAYI
ncbi:MAG: prepilin peptidase, partial [Actinobacteria bacterium]|nr:prepilin peptidase [Actinomycetota bacterium]